MKTRVTQTVAGLAASLFCVNYTAFAALSQFSSRCWYPLFGRGWNTEPRRSSAYLSKQQTSTAAYSERRCTVHLSTSEVQTRHTAAARLATGYRRRNGSYKLAVIAYPCLLGDNESMLHAQCFIVFSRRCPANRCFRSLTFAFVI